MLKKAGLIVAASAASLLALSPMAFAHEDGGHGDGQNSSSLLNGVTGNDSSVPVTVCNNDVQGGLVPFQDIDPNVPVDVTGLLGSKGTSPQAATGDTRGCGAAAGS